MAKLPVHNHVRRLREQRGLTQAELARRSGCTRQTIVMLEQERYVPSLALAFTVARTLGVPITEAFEPADKD
jgi:putative transcriptional regulator